MPGLSLDDKLMFMKVACFNCKLLVKRLLSCACNQCVIWTNLCCILRLDFSDNNGLHCVNEEVIKCQSTSLKLVMTENLSDLRGMDVKEMRGEAH